MGFEDKYKDMTLEEEEAALKQFKKEIKQLKKEMPFMVPGMTEEEAKAKEEEAKAKEEEIKAKEEEIKYLKGSINAKKSRNNLTNLKNNLVKGIGGGVNNVKEGLKDIKEYNETIKKYNEENTNTNKNKTLDENINKATFNSTIPKSDEKNTTDNTTTTGNTTTTDDTTTTLTKESAWNNYNKRSGTAKGLFENFNTLGMTAEDARKEFLSKVSTPSDAAKKAFKEIYGVDLVVTDDDKDDDKDKDKNKKYKSSMYGIIDAMKNKDIDVPTGIYFMLDALSKAARNTGIDIGNIGAQFSGGTVRNDYQDSLWNQRRSKMFENEMTSELNTQEGTDKEMEYNLAKEDLIGKGLTNEQADLALEASRTFKDKAEEFRKAGNDTMADLYALVGSAATREVGPEELAAIAASGVLNTQEGQEAIKEIGNAITGLMGSIGNTFGGLNAIMDFINGKLNKNK